MNQALGFGVLFAGGILLTKAVTGATFSQIAQGHPGTVSTTGQNLLSGGVGGAGQSLAGAIGNAAGAVTSTAKGALSKAQLEAAWISNGGNPAAADTAAAVALAESSGRLDAAGDVGYGSSGPTSFGPWQVHIPAHPQYSASRLTSDLNYSAKAAIAISNNGTDWTPWSTYNSGAYTKYL